MNRSLLTLLTATAFLLVTHSVFANKTVGKAIFIPVPGHFKTDTLPKDEVMDIIKNVIKASGTFNVDAVVNLYAPNATIADEEPPFSWTGPTAGVQWINAVQETCKRLKVKEFKGSMEKVRVSQQTAESIYVVVPVNYTGQIEGETFEEHGAFTFVFRLVSGKWLIKSQAWVPSRGM